MINLVMPMGGAGSRFVKEGIHTPKPLVDLFGKPFFFWATQSLFKFVPVETLTFVILRAHVQDWGLDNVIKQYYPQAQIVILDEMRNGAVLTSMAGMEAINNDQPIVFNDCDHMFIAPSFYQFCIKSDEELDGALLSFHSQDPKFSYLKYGQDGFVCETVEKRVISDEAICGAYYFKNKAVFTKAAENYLQACQYNEYFMSGVYNIMGQQGLKSKGFPVDLHIAFGTPEEYKQAYSHQDQFLQLL